MLLYVTLLLETAGDKIMWGLRIFVEEWGSEACPLNPQQRTLITIYIKGVREIQHHIDKNIALYFLAVITSLSSRDFFANKEQQFSSIQSVSAGLIIIIIILNVKSAQNVSANPVFKAPALRQSVLTSYRPASRFHNH